MILQISVNGSRFRKIMRQHDTVSELCLQHFQRSSNKRGTLIHMCWGRSDTHVCI